MLEIAIKNNISEGISLNEIPLRCIDKVKKIR